METKHKLWSLLIGSVLTFLGCQKEPTACIKTDKTIVEVGESINFQDCSLDSKKVEWDFGNGTSASGTSASYSYNVAGTYYIKMTASSKNDKKKDIASTMINVNDINKKFEGFYSFSNCLGKATVTASGKSQIVFDFVQVSPSFKLYATVSNSSFTIPTQNWEFPDGSYSEVTGSGNLNSNTITISIYALDYDDLGNYTGSENCSDSSTKQ